MKKDGVPLSSLENSQGLQLHHDLYQVVLIGNNLADILVGPRCLLQIVAMPDGVEDVLGIEFTDLLSQVEDTLGLFPAKDAAGSVGAGHERLRIAQPPDNVAAAALGPRNNAVFTGKSTSGPLAMHPDLPVKMDFFCSIVMGDIKGLLELAAAGNLGNNLLNHGHHLPTVGAGKGDAVCHFPQILPPLRR